MDHAVKLAPLAVREVELCTHLYQTLLGELFADGLALSQSSRDFFEKIDQSGSPCAENAQPRLSAEIFAMRVARVFFTFVPQSPFALAVLIV